MILQLSPRQSLFKGYEIQLFLLKPVNNYFSRFICYTLFSFQGTISWKLSFSVVGLSGLEPPTSRLSGVRSNRLSYKPIFPAFRLFPQAFGGDKRDRTADPLLAKQVLSQLSYTPVYLGQDPEN